MTVKAKTYKEAAAKRKETLRKNKETWEKNQELKRQQIAYVKRFKSKESAAKNLIAQVEKHVNCFDQNREDAPPRYFVLMLFKRLQKILTADGKDYSLHGATLKNVVVLVDRDIGPPEYVEIAQQYREIEADEIPDSEWPPDEDEDTELDEGDGDDAA